MSGHRLNWAAAERLAPRLSDRDWAIVRSLSSSRVLTGQQLSRLHFDELSERTRHRIRRRVLERLNDWQVVARLDRVIGGVRAGSTGWVYTLGIAGHRLIQLDRQQCGIQRIRRGWTPGSMFLNHSLDIAELYVQLIERTRTSGLSLSSFETEPDCWWPDGLGGFLKPDAYLVLRTSSFDELVWLEVDRGTESLPTLKRKLLTYTNFSRRGQLPPSGVMPHIVLSVPTIRRAEAAQAVIDAIQPDGDLFRVTTFDTATNTLIGLTSNDEHKPP